MALIRRTRPEIRRWDPWADFERLSERIERLFEEFLPTRYEDGERFAWSPAVEGMETERAYDIEVDLPGLKKNDVEIRVEGNTMTIQGERKWERDEKKENIHRRERFFGRFYRSFILPENADANKIKAKFENGVLKIEIPKAEKAVTKTIEIA